MRGARRSQTLTLRKVTTENLVCLSVIGKFIELCKFPDKALQTQRVSFACVHSDYSLILYSVGVTLHCVVSFWLIAGQSGRSQVKVTTPGQLVEVFVGVPPGRGLVASSLDINIRFGPRPPDYGHCTLGFCAIC